MRRSWARWVRGGIVTAAIAALVAWPLAELIGVTLERTPGELPGIPGDDAVGNTLVLALAVAVLTTALGAAAAFVTERHSFRGRRWLRLAVLLPILIPPFVSAMSWARAYGPSGLTDDLLGWDLPGLVGPIGIALVVSVNAMPIAFLLTAAAIRTRSDPELEMAARVSGAGRWRAARHVTLPLLRGALAGVAALAFVVAINAFGVPAILGTPAGFDTMTTRIYQDLVLSARPASFSRAILMATLLVVIALIFVTTGERLISGRRAVRRGVAAGAPAPRPPGSVPARAALWAIAIVAVAIPTVALILVALTKGVGLAPIPSNWTIANFQEAWGTRFVGALARSGFLAVTAASAALLLGGVTASFRHRRLGRISGVAALLAFAIPGSALAIAVLLAYGSVLRDTLLIILIAYVAKLWAVGHRSIDASIDNVADEMSFAARASGASGLTAIRTVTIPLLRPAIIGGWVLVFLFSFHELTMSSLLYGPGTDTLAVTILNLQQLGDIPVSSALAVLLTLPLLLIALPFLLKGNGSRPIVDTG